MGLEAVEYVKQAEEKIAELKRNSQSEAETILLKAEKEIQHNRAVLEQELNEFERVEKEKYESLLTTDKQAVEAEVAQEKELIRQKVRKNKENVVNDLVKVVFKRYGNS